MQVTHLLLRDFRNYEKAEVLFHPGLNVLTGANAQGKTNLLESLAVVSLTRSYRVSEDTQLIRYGAEGARVSCLVEEQLSQRLDVVITRAGKTLLINRQPVRRSSEFIGRLNVILFSPDDLRIFRDSPRERRRILDAEISKLSPAYLTQLSQYQKLLKQRNALLKSAPVDGLILDALDEQMTACEVPIGTARRQFCGQINSTLAAYYRRLSRSEDLCTLQYLACTEEAQRQSYADLLFDSRQRDTETGLTNTGIHREDLAFLLNERNVAETASQGQKRMVLLAFRLALQEVIAARSHSHPVLLLDDVLSELDPAHQEALMEQIPADCQCLLTSTQVPAVLQQLSYHEYHIENGTVTPLEKGMP